MLDIPMLQPTPKADRAETSNAAKAATTPKNSGQSDSDFETAYADESVNEASTASEEVNDPDKNASNEAKANNEETAETGDDLPNPGFGDLEKTENDLAAAAQPADKSPSQTPEKKPGTDTLEAAFAQQVKDVKTSEGTVAAPRESGLSEQSLSKPADAKPLVNSANAGAANAVTGEKQAAKGLDQQTAVKLSETAAPSAESGQTKTTLAAVSTTQQPQQAAPGANLMAKTESISKPKSELRLKGDEEPRVAPTGEASQPKPNAKNPLSSVSTTPIPVAQSTTQISAQADLSGLELTAPAADLDSPALWDARGSSPAALAQALSRPETPAMIGRQMAEFLQRLPDRPVELSLNPEELGRVRLSISVAEGGITVSVLAERPETLDLMRRNIDQLAREFQNLGYENIGFAFNEGQSGESSKGDSTEFGSNHSNSAGEEEMNVAPTTLVATSGVDMRL